MVSIYEIGSVARASNDKLSDKDLLAVGCPLELNSAVSRYVSEGWNVAKYSRLEFEHMAGSHSLFVQHVKQDGQAIRDDQDYLKSLLARYKTKRNYFQQLPAAISPIFWMSETESGYWAKLLQADILYVAVRNACILHRATCASPRFDFSILIEWISGIVGLSSAEEEVLKRLRKLKHAYRARNTMIDVSDLPEATRIAKKLAAFWADLSETVDREQEYSNGYFEVRALELQLVRAVGPIFMDSLDQTHDLAELWATICRSDPYKPRPPRLLHWSTQVSEFLSKQYHH